MPLGIVKKALKVWQLPSLLFPSGNAVPTDFCAKTSLDLKALILTVLSVIGISVTLLLAQAVTLNGSYLAVTGYICGEWIEVTDLQKESQNKGGSSNPSQWDPKKKSTRRADIVAVNRPFSFPRQVFYKATSNAPEGKPFDVFLRATHDMFRNELGHPSTSKLLTFAIHGYLIFIAVLLFDVLVSGLVSDTSHGKLFALAGNIIACYGAVKAGLTKSSEVGRIAAEVAN